MWSWLARRNGDPRRTFSWECSCLTASRICGELRRDAHNLECEERCDAFTGNTITLRHRLIAEQDNGTWSLIAVVAATIATVTATMAAIATTRTAPYRGLTFKYAFINQPLMVPEIVTAVALLIVFSRLKVWTGYSGLGYLIAAHTAFCIPFAYMPIRARLEGMDLTLERAAADLYATPWAAFRRVTLPLLWPGILAGFMLAFVISLDDVVITEFVKSAGQETLPTYMLGQLKRSVTPEINAISTVFLGISILLVTMFFLISRKKT